MNPSLAALTGTTLAYILVGVVILRLIAGRFVAASGLPVFDGVVALLLGGLSLGFLNPAGVPVIGLAFAAIGVLRESRERKRAVVFVVLVIALVLCGYATLIALRHSGDDYHP